MRAVQRTGRPLLLLLLLTQCRPAVDPRPIREEGAFAFLVGDDTTVVEEYARTPSELRGTIRMLSREPGGPTVRAVYAVRFTPSGGADSAYLEIRQVSPSGAAEPQPRWWSADFGPDGRVLEIEQPGGRRTESLAGAGALPLFGPSIAMLESVFLHARATGATHLPIFHLAAAARVDTAAVQWVSGDTVHLSIAGATGSYHVDRAGRILGGTSADEDLRTVRLR